MTVPADALPPLSGTQVFDEFPCAESGLSTKLQYPLAKNPVYWTFQSEGHLRHQMAFVRLAGCSVNCPKCDTDYSVHLRMDASNIASLVHLNTPRNVIDRWVWVTGGEPAIHDLVPLVRELHDSRYQVALATSGHHKIAVPIDWLSVSPHIPSKWIQTFGHELKVVPGLWGYGIEEFASMPNAFWYRFVQPLWDLDKEREDPASLKECVQWMRHHPNWGLSRQDHKIMGWP